MPGEMKLLPCGHCGAAKSEMFTTSGDPGYRRQRVCMVCGAAGPYADNEELADAAWNRRTPELNPSVVYFNSDNLTPEERDQLAEMKIAPGHIVPISIPESGTSIVRWVRYDGTPETLPGKGKDVILRMAGEDEFEIAQFDDSPVSVISGPKPDWVKSSGCCYPVQVGDLWAYLSQPPEGMG